ncbi:mCG147863 [Mus musculus]|jgi:hypothetical protein|nr:mCG147863 [Mus musculus]
MPRNSVSAKESNRAQQRSGKRCKTNKQTNNNKNLVEHSNKQTSKKPTHLFSYLIKEMPIKQQTYLPLIR